MDTAVKAILEQMEKQNKLMMDVMQKLVPQSTQGTLSSNSNSNVTIVNNFENFDAKKESFIQYKERFENYLSIRGLTTNSVSCVQILLNSIGAENYKLVSSLCAPKDIKSLTYVELTKMLEEHLCPKPNFMIEQHRFLSRVQKKEESIAEYVAALKAFVPYCEFKCQEETCGKSVAECFLRAQFIRGLYNKEIRGHIMTMENPTFENCYKMAIKLEASNVDNEEISQKNMSESSTEIKAVCQKGQFQSS